MEHTVLAKLMSTLNESHLDHCQDTNPDIPVFAKAEDNRIIAAQLRKDAEHFTALNLDAVALADELDHGAEALMSSSLMHETEGELSDEALKVWKAHKDEVPRLRDEVLPMLNFIAATQKDEHLAQQIKEISRGVGHKDAIQDLGLCANLTKRYEAQLAERNYGADKIARLGEVFQTVEVSYPLAQHAREQKDASQQLRNRAFWHLDALETKIKKIYLPMVFWNDGSYRSRYASRYHRSNN